VDLQKTSDGWTALLGAMQGTASGAVKRAQAAGRSADECITPNDLLPIRRLLAAAADPNQACSQSATPCAISPLLFAVHVGYGVIVEMLLRAKALPDHADPKVPKPLLVACANSNAPCAKLLLEAGALVEPLDAGATPMTIACECGQDALGIVELLLQFKASPDRADACGNTPLMWACEANAEGVAELLLNARACPRRVNMAGDAALNIALKHAQAKEYRATGTPLVELLTRHTAMTAPALLQRRVELRGLSGRPELNGCRGVAVSFDPKTGRYGVQLDGKVREKVALRPATLRAVGDG